MSGPVLIRRWGSRFELADLLEAMPGGRHVGVRDFALITLAGQLSVTFPRQLVFKGGFVLRHVHGFLRFSKDVDATRHEPPAHKLQSAEMAEAIREASIRNTVQFTPAEPATDSARSLDFANVRVEGDTFEPTTVQVEVSYREAVLEPPVPAAIGAPFYEDFEILTMATDEMVAEKIRALAQRQRDTDLADLAAIFASGTVTDDAVGRLVQVKFELVAAGQANRSDRIEANLREMADSYDTVVPGLFPDAPSYREAVDIVWPRIRRLIP